MNSCVYFLIFQDVGLIKVGYSSSVVRRYRTLMSAYGKASEHSLILRCEEELAKKIERSVLEQFESERVSPSRVEKMVKGSLVNKGATECFDLKLRRQLEDYVLRERLSNPHSEISNLGALFVEEGSVDIDTVFELKDSIKNALKHISKYRKVSTHTKPYW
ncbi:GIY-YIG nuclease family protein [Alteromonas gracilis]|uniref:Bacteriophage T5 Orf172 DNA-binding domain-containing protein n=1 Tax=Alteromonas gracilis TaxID=1479524 RepID=A0ABX5CPW3_9ALTE|nr:GIY-YIG nuclease family protein [Alteromonas gracilis]PRO68892.1 hypothetical protein C6Y39_10035 [Alteromonas gracilis]